MDTINKKTLIISYITQFFQYGIAIIVLPVILHLLDAKDLGIWYIFLSFSHLIGLLDFGFSPSIQRSAAYVASGAKELKQDGFEITQNTQIHLPLLASLLDTSRSIYKKISLAILILGLTFGTVYLYFTLKDDFNMKYICFWGLYLVSVASNFYVNYLLSFLRGLGYINDYNINVIISKSVYIGTLYMFIINGTGLLSLILATFFNTIVMIVLAYRVLNKKIPSFTKLTDCYDCENLFPVLWKNAKNSGLVSVGVFLLSQSGVFLSGLFLGLEDVASLGLCIQLFTTLVVCSRVYLTTYTPLISALWTKNDKKQIRHIFIKCQIIGYLIFVTGFITIAFGGDWILLNIIHSNVCLPNLITLSLYGLFYLMEITHGNCCSLISTSNNIPFTKASLIAGAISVICTVLYAELGLGIISFPLALVSGSLPYNSWKWPLFVFNKLK